VKTLYAVSSGSYSDHTIHVLFERESDAQAFIDTDDGERYQPYFIEQYPLCAAGERPRKRSWFEVVIGGAGTVTHERKTDAFIKPEAYVWHTPSRGLQVVGYSGRSHAHAAKVARDRLTQEQAKRAGL
jgi:hypothetical protein